MIMFGKYKFVLEMCGLNPQGGRKNHMARIVYSVIFFFFTLLTSTFLALNFQRDTDQSLSVVCILLSHMAIISTYFHLLINRKQFYALLDEMQDIVNESV